MTLPENNLAPNRLHFPYSRGAVDPAIFDAEHPLTALPDGGVITDGHGDPHYEIENDGRSITLTALGWHAFGQAHPYDPTTGRRNHEQDVIVNRIQHMTWQCPATSELFGCNEVDGQIVSCKLPTLGVLNEFQQDRLGDLPTAGIQLVQAADIGNTPIDSFMQRLRHKEASVSLEVMTYIHDVFVHSLGVMSLQEEHFAAYMSLYDMADDITGSDPETREGFIDDLGDAFELSTGRIIDTVMNPQNHNGYNAYLLSKCLAQMKLHNRHPDVMARTKAAIHDLGMGVAREASVRYNPLTGYTIPWEEQVLGNYYASIAERLR